MRVAGLHNSPNYENSLSAESLLLGISHTVHVFCLITKNYLLVFNILIILSLYPYVQFFVCLVYQFFYILFLVICLIF